MFWLGDEIQAKPCGLVQWAGLQPVTRCFDSFHPHDQFFMIFFFFFLPTPILFPPAVRLHRFISSLFAILSGNNKFKIMTAVRVDAGVARKQEKGSFVISDSVSAIQCQRNTHNTYAVLRTMSPRHQSGEWNGESKGGGGRGTEKQLRKTDWEKTQRPKLPVIVEMHGVIRAGYLYSISTEQLTSASASVCSFTTNEPLALLSLQSKWELSKTGSIRAAAH